MNGNVQHVIFHTTFEAQDYALRTTEAVAIWDDGNFLLKGNNFWYSRQ